jgi:hypothetical protein
LTWDKLTIRILPAGVLLTAGLLKLHYLFTDVFLQHSTFFSTRLELAFAAIEVVFAIWLLSVGKHIVDWMICAALFVGFAIVSTLLIIMGQTTCGCFGVVHTSPWFSLGLDLAVLLFITRYRPVNLSVNTLKTLFTSNIAFVAVGVIAIFVVGSAMTSLFTSTKLNESFNDEIVCLSDAIWVGEQAEGKSVNKSVQFNNLTSSPIRIIGGHGGHGDDLVSALPVIVDANSSSTVPIKVRIKGSPGIFSRRIVFYTTSERNWQVVVRINGRVTN